MPSRPMPAAEVDVTSELVRSLLKAQHPDLADLALEVVANGWDNVVMRLGDELAVRLPRREAAAEILRNEQRWLPVLAPRLPLPVPAPVRVGEAGVGYPWAWSVVPFLPGRPATDTPPRDYREAAVTLGEFFGALHLAAPQDAPVNPVRGVPLERHAKAFAENMRIAGGELSVVGDVGRAMGVWEAALAAPVWDGPPVWVHGDPHPANVLVEGGRVSAVIDFGDVAGGDPATDLAVMWMVLPGEWHETFCEAYCEAQVVRGNVGVGKDFDDALWVRARGWALHFAMVFLAYSADNPQLREVGLRAGAAVLG